MQNQYHSCHALYCTSEISPSFLMCRTHWRMVPRNLQNDVWQHYRRGQEKDKRVTEACIRAQVAAINAVARKEKHQPIDVEARVALLKKNGYFDWEQAEATPQTM